MCIVVGFPATCLLAGMHMNYHMQSPFRCVVYCASLVGIPSYGASAVVDACGQDEHCSRPEQLAVQMLHSEADWLLSFSNQ